MKELIRHWNAESAAPLQRDGDEDWKLRLDDKERLLARPEAQKHMETLGLVAIARGNEQKGLA